MRNKKFLNENVHLIASINLFLTYSESRTMLQGCPRISECTLRVQQDAVENTATSGGV